MCNVDKQNHSWKAVLVKIAWNTIIVFIWFENYIQPLSLSLIMKQRSACNWYLLPREIWTYSRVFCLHGSTQGRLIYILIEKPLPSSLLTKIQTLKAIWTPKSVMKSTKLHFLRNINYATISLVILITHKICNSTIYLCSNSIQLINKYNSWCFLLCKSKCISH